MAINRISRIRDPEGEQRMDQIRETQRQRLFGQRRYSNSMIKERLEDAGHNPMNTRSNEELNRGHFILHSWDKPGETDWSEDDIVLEHRRLSRKMEERGIKHDSNLTDPFGDGHDSQIQRNAREDAQLEAMAEATNSNRDKTKDYGLGNIPTAEMLGGKAKLTAPETKNSKNYF